MLQPLVSVIIPCYNHRAFVKQAISSVIAQDYENIEMIIIDDGSIDNSIEIIESMRDACEVRFSRFKIVHRANKGLASTLNEGLAWCKGEFLSPLASDDIMLLNKISIQVEYLLKEPLCASVFGGASILKEDGSTVVERSSVAKKYTFKDIILNKYILFTASQMLRLDMVRKVGGYNPDRILEDWYMNLKLTEHGNTLDSIEDILVGYRRHANNTSNNISLLHEDRIKILEAYKANKYYKAAMIEFYYTKSKELVSESKTQSLRFLLYSLYSNPKSLWRGDTLKLAVKIFVPSKVLKAKRLGK